ncbi:uncharacterized protein V3H86_013794 [Mergus octosetaceus]
MVGTPSLVAKAAPPAAPPRGSGPLGGLRLAAVMESLQRQQAARLARSPDGEPRRPLAEPAPVCPRQLGRMQLIPMIPMGRKEMVTLPCSSYQHIFHPAAGRFLDHKPAGRAHPGVGTTCGEGAAGGAGLQHQGPQRRLEGTTVPTLQEEEEEDGTVPAVPGRIAIPVGLASLAAAQAVAASQAAVLEQLWEKLETGEPPEKKVALTAEEQQQLMQQALQHNLLAMASQFPMNIKVSNQDDRQETALNLPTNSISSINMSIEINGVVYTGVLFSRRPAAPPAPGGGGTQSQLNPTAILNPLPPAPLHSHTPASAVP